MLPELLLSLRSLPQGGECSDQQTTANGRSATVRGEAKGVLTMDDDVVMDEAENGLMVDEGEMAALLDRMCAHLDLREEGQEAQAAARREKGWRIVESLKLPTAMHAHSAITIPLLPVP